MESSTVRHDAVCMTVLRSSAHITNCADLRQHAHVRTRMQKPASIANRTAHNAPDHRDVAGLLSYTLVAAEQVLNTLCMQVLLPQVLRWWRGLERSQDWRLCDETESLQSSSLQSWRCH